MKPIETREDISILVHQFYDKIRQDELLGPIFNTHITDNEWPIHLSKLTDFWETNLFGVANPKVNPTQKHQAVDKNLDYSISPAHFGKWLELWFQTIDELYNGELAVRAKLSARKNGNWSVFSNLA